METDFIIKLAKAYTEELWTDFANLFPKVDTDNAILKEMPNDVVNVLVGLLGIDQVKEWVCIPLKRLDNQIIKDLIKTDTGLKAAKMFILSMRI
jgi:hypothetical protein